MSATRTMPVYNVPVHGIPGVPSVIVSERLRDELRRSLGKLEQGILAVLERVLFPDPTSQDVVLEPGVREIALQEKRLVIAARRGERLVLTLREEYESPGTPQSLLAVEQDLAPVDAAHWYRNRLARTPQA